MAPLAAVALICAGTLAGTVVASADPGLPAKTASELLVDLQAAEPTALSGTIESTADLGLPELPAMGSAGPSGGDLTALVSGTHTLRVWSDGAQRSRLDLLSAEQETDVYRNGSDMWIWSSSDRTAEHMTRDDAQTHSGPMPDLPAGVSLPSTPQEAADQVLAALDPSTTVTATGVAKVAGRPVYELVLTPRQGDTLVARVAIAIDAETSTPLRVRVYSRELQDPAFAIGFTSVDFGPVDDAVFAFDPPPGATVTDHALTQPEGAGAKPSPDVMPTIVGSGWETVVVAHMPLPTNLDASAGGSGDALGSASAMLDLLPVTTGPWGSGRVLAGTLFSVIITDDGTIAIGAVAPDALGAALAAS